MRKNSKENTQLENEVSRYFGQPSLSPFAILNLKFLALIIYQIITVSQFVYYIKRCNDFPYFH